MNGGANGLVMASPERRAVAWCGYASASSRKSLLEGSRWPLERELARHVEVLGWSCSIFLLGNAEQCAVFANERG